MNSFSRRYFGLRFSPIIQVGRIAGFMPTDTAAIPYGLQTDIIGTGGSSGSPIVDTSVGIAQQVIQAGVVVNSSPKKTFVEVNMGLVYGLSNHVLHGIYEKAQDFLDREKGAQRRHIMLGSGFKNIPSSRNR